MKNQSLKEFKEKSYIDIIKEIMEMNNGYIY